MKNTNRTFAILGAAGVGLCFGLSALAKYGHDLHTASIESCNKGELAECRKVPSTRAAEITNKAFKAELAKKQAEKEAAEREANKWQPTQTNVRQLAFACGQRLKPFLKDPSSFRILDRGMSKLTETDVTVWVDYTATNGFGGPTRDTYSCTYTR